MTVETSGLFAQVIQDHLELKRRNSTLDGNMPIGSYMTDDPFENHPLFKSEEQARIEETLDGEQPAIATEEVSWPGVELTAEDVKAHAFAAADDSAEDSGLWTRSRDFDWGD